MIADVFASRFASANVLGYPPRDSALAKLFGMGGDSLAGAKVNTKSVLGLSAVFRAVNIIGNDVAKCKPFLYQRMKNGRPDPLGPDNRMAVEHPSWRPTVRKANRWMSAGEFRKTLTVAAMLRGNGIGHVERGVDGRVLEYTPLLPDRTGMAIFGKKINEETQMPEDPEVLYWTKVDGQMRTILPENIIHIRGLSHNGVWGLDVIEIMRDTFGLAIAARDCGARFYGQGMLGSGILYMPPELTKGPKAEETIANFIKSVKDQAQGLSRAHRLLVIDQGAKYEKLSVDPEGAQALQTREFEIEEIANVTGCAAHKLGSKARKSYASIEQSNQEHLDDDIDPWLTRWEEAIEETSLTEDEKDSGSHYVQCQRKALMRTNLQARTSYYTAGRNGGWLSANDIRRAEGDDPIDDGDTYLVPANMTPADQAGAAFDVARTSDDEEEDDDDEDSEKAQLAADFQAVAMHEVNRLVTRSLESAARNASKPGQQFLDYLDSLEGWCREPAALAPVLTAVAGRIRAELNKFTEAPYAASDLRQNIQRSTEAIAASALAVADELLGPSNPKVKEAA